MTLQQALPLRQVINGDCLEVMQHIESKSIDLVICDPPYNIGKDTWDKIENYEAWLQSVFLEIQRVLKDNGSFYWFHSEAEVIAEMMVWLKHHSNFIFRQFIIWNKRFKGSPNKGFLDGYVEVDGLRNYQQMAEYILYYTFQDETGLTSIFGNRDCFQAIKNYLRKEKLQSNLSNKDFNHMFSKYTDKIGCLDRSVIEHYFGDKQWCFPTKDIYENVLQKTGRFQRRYEDLRKEYEDLRFIFNNQKTHHSVWNYDISTETGHPTEKPEALIANIIKHSSKQDSIILDPCAGSGTTALVAEKLQRKWIAIEKDENYCRIARKRLEPWMNQTRLDTLGAV